MPDEDGDERDPYLAVTAAMPAGLLVTVNESTPTSPATGELKVQSADEDGTLHLVESPVGSFEDTHYRLQADGDGGVELVELDDEGHGTGWTTVETIEVVGIAE